MSKKPEPKLKPLPAPWDRIFRLGTRTFVWGSIFGLLYILRPFFLLVFLTFVFAYIQAHGVERLERWIGNRVARVVLVFLLFLACVTGAGFFVVPNLTEQAGTLATTYPQYLNDIDRTIGKILHGYSIALPEHFSESVVKNVLGFGEEKEGAAALQKTVSFLKDVGIWLLAIGSAFFLSLLFSLLIVLDQPKLSRQIRGLAHTRLGWIYEEVAESIQDFCRILGRALEAQFLIALANTALTAVGLSILGLSNIVFLSTIVFLCSFIPVAGVFISSTPICLVALQTSGPGLMLLCIGLILIVHFIEAYMLNPNIYGHHLRMNPFIVLGVLTIAGKLFGVWGLILGLPVTNYVFGHAIRPARKSSVESAERPFSRSSAEAS